jgi:hypothetical protein
MGAPLTITCKTLTVPAPPPSLSIPHFGVLEKAREGLDQIPDPIDMLCKFQDQLALALAPVRRYLEMVEAFLTIRQCMTVIPDAIVSLDPSTIYDCLKALVKAVARLLSWMPPLAYVRTAMEICSYCIDLVDGVLELFDKVDAKLTKWINIYELAEQVGDLELIAFVGCGASQVNAFLPPILAVLQFVEPINDTLMDMFIRLMNSEGLRDAVEKYREVNEYYQKAQTVLEAGGLELPELPGFTPPPKEQHIIVPIPPLAPMLEAMGQQRNAMVYLYNLLAPFVGEEGDKESREIPEYVNF